MIRIKTAGALATAAIVLTAAAFFSACATAPRPPQPTAGQKAAARQKDATQPKRRPLSSLGNDYLKNSLSEFSTQDLPRGGKLVVRRMSGRRVAAAEICLLYDKSAIDKEEGIEALGLLLAARGAATQKAGALPALLQSRGASLALKSLDGGELCLELVAPNAEFARSLCDVAAALARPAFAEGRGLSAEEFAAAKRNLELKALRRESDSSWAGSPSLKPELSGGRPRSEAALGSLKSLYGLDQKKTAEHWEKAIVAARFRIAVVGDIDPASLAAALAPSLAAMPAESPASQAASRSEQPAAQSPIPTDAQDRGADTLATAPGSKQTSPGAAYPGAAYLGAAFPAPAAASADRAALSLALSMLEDSLEAGLKDLRFEAGFSESREPSGWVALKGAFSPAVARESIEKSIGRLADGSSSLLSGPSLEDCKERAIARIYSPSGSSAELALRIAEDLASGGDGSSYFRLGDGVLAATGADVGRVARESLARERISWRVAASPEELARFSESQGGARAQ
jgi:predicted Zn-dependent peptidase